MYTYDLRVYSACSFTYVRTWTESAEMEVVKNGRTCLCWIIFANTECLFPEIRKVHSIVFGANLLMCLVLCKCDVLYAWMEFVEMGCDVVKNYSAFYIFDGFYYNLINIT